MAKPGEVNGYRTTRWQSLRKVILDRDSYTCQMCGAILRTGRSDARATAMRPAVVDHIIPHRGKDTLFWHRANLWAVCCDCHDSACKRIESAHKGQLTPRQGTMLRDAKLRHRAVGMDGFALVQPDRAVMREHGWREVPGLLGNK